MHYDDVATFNCAFCDLIAHVTFQMRKVVVTRNSNQTTRMFFTGRCGWLGTRLEGDARLLEGRIKEVLLYCWHQSAMYCIMITCRELIFSIDFTVDLGLTVAIAHSYIIDGSELSKKIDTALKLK